MKTFRVQVYTRVTACAVIEVEALDAEEASELAAEEAADFHGVDWEISDDTELLPCDIDTEVLEDEVTT